jgi:ABC-type transport system involved in multi-copper enzyme maturation permease subunit
VTGLLAADFLKLRKRIMPRVLLLILLAIIALVFFGQSRSGTQRNLQDVFLPNGLLLGLLYASVFAPFLVPILAGSWAGSEYGWGTIRTILSRRPNRSQFVLSGVAVLLVASAIALVTTLLLAAAGGGLASTLLHDRAARAPGLTGSYWGVLVELFLSAWLVLAFYAVLAYSAGTLFRSGAVGIGVGIGLTLADLILTGIFTGLGGTWRDIARHFPGVYTRSLPVQIASHHLSSIGTPGSDLPGVGESVVALAVYTLVPLAIALVLVRYRDVTA